MSKWWEILWRASKAWFVDNAFKHSAAVSFYTLFSMAPVSVIAITLMSVFLGAEVASMQFSSQITGLVGTASAEMIRTATSAAMKLEAGNPVTASFGVLLLVIGATTVFSQLQDSLNEIWRVRPKKRQNGIVVLLVRRLVSFAMVLTIGFLLLVSLVLTTTLTTALGTIHGRIGTAPWLLKTVDFGVSTLVITCLFGLLFKYMPDIHLKWRNIWLGAFLTALLFGLGRFLIALYLAHSTVASIYGAAASLVALLVWVYYSCAIFFFGAEFTRAHHLWHHPHLEPAMTAMAWPRFLFFNATGAIVWAGTYGTAAYWFGDLAPGKQSGLKSGL